MTERFDEFDPRLLADPTETTRREFESAQVALDGLANNALRSRALKVELTGRERARVAIHGFHARDPEGGYENATLSVVLQRGDDENPERLYRIQPGYPIGDFWEGVSAVRILDDIRYPTARVPKEGTEDARKADWLGEVFDAAGEAHTRQIGELLDKSPYPIAEADMAYINAQFKNGTCVTGDWISDPSPEFRRAHPPDRPTRIIWATSGAGKIYRYEKFGYGSEGVEHLDVRQSQRAPGERLGPELQRHPGIIARAMREHVEQIRRAKELGVTRLTEGKMRELAKVLKEATEHGLASPES